MALIVLSLARGMHWMPWRCVLGICYGPALLLVLFFV
jgi:hypothetical protein